MPKQSVLYRPVDGGAVLLSVNDEVYYGLNAVGGFVWEHLPPVLQTVDELIAALSAQYADVPTSTIRADVTELLEDLLRNGLIAAPHETPQPAPQGLG